MSAAAASHRTLPVTPSFRLDGLRALVTGASRGIGYACAAALAAAGADVSLAARSEAELKEIAALIRAAGGKAETISLDVSDVAAVERILGAEAAFDILFNNAGVNRQGPIGDVSEADFDFVADINMKAAFFVAKTVAKGMIAARKGGSIINTSSMMGHVAGPNRTTYVMSKHAVEGLTKALAIELGPHGIRVNSVAPAVIETEMTAPILSDPSRRKWLEGKTALGRFGRLEDIMGPVLFLASDASAFVTGTSLLVDGGWTAQ